MKAQHKGITLHCLINFVCSFLVGVFLVNRLSLLILKRHVTSCQKSHLNQSQYYIDDIPPLNQHKQPFILIGVMTTRQNLKTRVAAICRTWAKFVPGKVIFFVGKGEKYVGNLPVVVLDEALENIYPPQRKSFLMLKYIHDHYLDMFEWFMRADDDIFIRPKDLEQFLRSVNSLRRLYIGQPGLGTPEERGKLGLENKASFYCLGGPGVVFTRDTLRQTALSFSACLRNTFTSHEDTELGRCVQQTTGVACTSAHEFSKLFYQNYGKKNGSFQGQLDHRLTHALTLHPVKESQYVYRLQNHFSIKNMFELKTKIRRLKNIIFDINMNLHQLPSVSPNSERVNELLSKNTTQKNEGRDDTEVWGFIRGGIIYSPKEIFQMPFVNLQRMGRQIGMDIAILSLNRFRRKSKVFFSYEKYSPISGLEHLIVMKNNKSVLKPYATIQRFQATEIAETPMEIADIPTEIADIPTKPSHQDGVIYMILPLYKRSTTFANFLISLNNIVSSYHSNIFLRVVLYLDNDNEHMTIINYVKQLDGLNNRLKTEVFEMIGKFSRAKAITRGFEGLSPNTLVVAIDVDMLFTEHFLRRVVVNTKLGKQAYFPIYFTQYDPFIVCYGRPNCHVNKSDFEFGQDYGTWRFFSFGIVGIYKSDFTKVGGFDTTIEGWGKEDTDFFEKCVKYGLNTFRSIDPGLLHVYHKRVCDVTLKADQFRMCITSREALYGPQSILADIVTNITSLE